MVQIWFKFNGSLKPFQDLFKQILFPFHAMHIIITWLLGLQYKQKKIWYSHKHFVWSSIQGKLEHAKPNWCSCCKLHVKNQKLLMKLRNMSRLCLLQSSYQEVDSLDEHYKSWNSLLTTRLLANQQNINKFTFFYHCDKLKFQRCFVCQQEFIPNPRILHNQTRIFECIENIFWIYIYKFEARICKNFTRILGKKTQSAVISLYCMTMLQMQSSWAQHETKVKTLPKQRGVLSVQLTYCYDCMISCFNEMLCLSARRHLK